MVCDIVEEARSWVGTPYHHHGRVKAVGVDCAMLLAEVYERAGVVPKVDPGVYDPQFGMHRSQEQFMSWVLKYGTEVEEPKVGGVILFKYGRCFSHGGIIVSQASFVHAVINAGCVIESRLDEPEYCSKTRKFFEVNHGR
jgi:cell wall-associated NlpC family hydrolase